MAKERNKGSSTAARVIGGFLLLVAVAIFIWGMDKFDWHTYKKLVDGGSCALFGIILLWWAKEPLEKYKDNSGGHIGNETITMVVAVVTAAIAILTLTDAASKTPPPTAQEIGAAVKTALQQRESVTRENPVDVIRHAQQRLTDLQYGPGVVDGMLGPRTEKAVRRFQTDKGLPVTATLDKLTLAKLE